MSTVGLPTSQEAQQTGDAPQRRPKPRKARLPGGRALPYALVIPSVVALVGILGYPLIYLVRISFQSFERAQLFGFQPAEWIGLDNYRTFISDDQFVAIMARTLGFTAGCVILTVGAGLGIALLMQSLSRWVRLPLLVALMFAWAMPPLSAVAVFNWLFDFEAGVVNYLIDLLPFVEFTRHHWFLNPWQGFAVIVLMIAWGAVPFVAVTLHAALTQVPQELVEAARIDGAQRFTLFRAVVLPVIRPVLLIVTVLSVIWDFGIVAQIFAMLNGTPSEDYFTLPVYSYMVSIVGSDFGLGAAAAVITVLCLVALTFTFIRQMLANQEID